MKLIHDVYEGAGASVRYFEEVSAADIEALHAEMEAGGFSCDEENFLGENTFSFYKKGEASKLLAYYPKIGQAKLVSDENPIINGLSDRTGKKICEPLLSMVDTFDFGLSFVIRLEDGRVAEDSGEAQSGEAIG